MNTFELEFIDDTDGPQLYPAMARVRVAIMSGDGIGDRPPRCITANCVSVQELDWQINSLINQLEDVRKQGHREFTQYARKREAAH